MRYMPVITLCLLLTLGSAVIPIAFDAQHEIAKTDVTSVSQFPHDPVLITSDSSWVSQGWPGNGTPEDPYLILSLWISDDINWGIWISNSDSHFVISSCLINGDLSEGIHIENCLNATIVDTTVNGVPKGIVVENTDYLTIENCEALGATAGLTLDGIGMASVSTSKFRGGTVACDIRDSLIVFNNNNVTNSGKGILAVDLFAGQFYNNTIENCENFGLDFFENSMACIIMHNNFTGLKSGGLIIRSSTLMVVSENSFTDCGMTVLGSELTHFTHSVLDNTVNGKPLLYAIGLSSQEINSDDYGQLFFVYCQDITVQGGSITRTQSAISFCFSTGCLVDDVSIDTCYAGVYFTYSNFTTIEDSSITNCILGIHLANATTNVNIINNLVRDSDEYGIIIHPGATDNLLVNNTFVNNELGLCDNDLGNSWDDGVEFGNIYDDYSGTGVYEISGAGEAVDHFPRKYEAPTTTTTTTQPTGNGDGLNQTLVIIGILGAVGIVVILIIVVKLRRK